MSNFIRGGLRACPPPTTSGTSNFYVNTTSGVDSNSGALGSPKKTLQAMLDAIDHEIHHTIVLNVSGSTSLSGTVTKVGSGAVTILATMAAVTPTTGAASGTAGSGTTPTSLVKPTAAANWTASDLQGKMVTITSGPGAGETRVILDNDTTTLTIFSISGLDNTSVFSIVEPSTTVSSLTVSKTGPTVTVQNCVVDACTVSESLNFKLVNCMMDTPVGAGTLQATDNLKVTLTGCNLNSLASAVISYTQSVTVEEHYSDDAQVAITNAQYVYTTSYVHSCTVTAMSVAGCVKCEMGCEANSCTVTPVVLSGCNLMTSTGSGLIGSGNTLYGIDISDGGRYDLTGATVTGSSGDFTIEGTADTYSQLATHTAIMSDTTVIVTS